MVVWKVIIWKIEKGIILKESDFENNNYFLLHIQYSECHEYDVYPTDYEIKDGIINLTIKYRTNCGLCASEHDFYVLKLDKNISTLGANINNVLMSSETCDPDIAYKPLIYLYPKKRN